MYKKAREPKQERRLYSEKMAASILSLRSTLTRTIESISADISQNS
eukprot:SAG11_NODE_36124_length_263_cov_0.634146_1_plen_45_part_10